MLTRTQLRRGVLPSSLVQVEPEAVEPTAPPRPTRSTRRERIPTCPRPPPNSINDTTIDLTDDSVDQVQVQDNVFPEIQLGILAVNIPGVQTRESENPDLNQEEGLVNVDDTLEEEDGQRAGDILERVIDVDTEEEVHVEQQEYVEEEEVVRFGNRIDVLLEPRRMRNRVLHALRVFDGGEVRRDTDVTIIDLTKSPAPPRIRSRENSSSRQSNTATHQEGGESEDTSCPICLMSIWELKKDGLISTVCGHVFCSPCFYSALYRADVGRPTCPVCRGSLARSNSYHPLYL